MLAGRELKERRKGSRGDRTRGSGEDPDVRELDCTDGDVYLPTKQEIRDACRDIQRTWSHSDRLRRMGMRSTRSDQSPVRRVQVLLD